MTSLLKPNSDPHGYEPRAGDVKALARADLVVRSGGEIDEWLEEAQAGAGSDAPVLTLGEHTREEPHWWQDPRAALRAVAVLRDGLTGRRGREGALRGQRRALLRRAATARPRDRALHRHDPGGAAQARHDPRRARRLRPPLRARGDRHGDPLALHARPGLGGRDAELVRTIQRERVPAVFAESSVRSDVEDAIAREAGARVAPALWADSLGPKGSAGATYIASMKANTHTIAAALGGDLDRCP